MIKNNDLEEKDSNFIDMSIEICSRLCMDLITNVFYTHYDPSWIASNTDSITTDAAYFNVVFNTSHQYAWYASNGGTSWVGLESRNNTSWDSWNVSDFHASGLYINFSGWYQTNS